MVNNYSQKMSSQAGQTFIFIWIHTSLISFITAQYGGSPGYPMSPYGGAPNYGVPPNYGSTPNFGVSPVFPTVFPNGPSGPNYGAGVGNIIPIAAPSSQCLQAPFLNCQPQQTANPGGCANYINCQGSPVKPGSCPQQVPYVPHGSTGPCTLACTNDHQCQQTEKCCSNGCGFSCMPMVLIAASNGMLPYNPAMNNMNGAYGTYNPYPSPIFRGGLVQRSGGGKKLPS